MRNRLAHEIIPKLDEDESDFSCFKNGDIVELLKDDIISNYGKQFDDIFSLYDLSIMYTATKYIAGNILYMREVALRL